ncbi:hypothetical protein BLS_009899 [Venturia inaequalis]|uniref:Major facilitator superfamily (MFS) profile domain-containing protein n=1 Tax=Venturia inaequalis TaxID=5025 RepID=A0A8H3U2X8_VENIN|nr:hypothetical protein BLS_009899 [Venturia inaequalis]
MEKEYDNVEALPATDAYLGVEENLEHTGKNNWARLWPVIACGAGLFSDGYLNNVIGSVGTMLQRIYTKPVYKPSQANVGSITFAGTVLGMLLFGYTSDKFSRKWSLMGSTLIIVVFAILGTGAWGPSPHQLFACLTGMRFFLGVGIGGEYPSGSVGAAEGTAELKAGTRNWWFIMFTNVMIDFGFVIGAFVPMLAVGEDHLRLAWRLSLGFGILPPLALLFLRFKLQEPEVYKRNAAKFKTPWLLAARYYWPRLLAVCAIWFIYDWISYSFGIYFTDTLTNLTGSDKRLWVNFGWNTLMNFFYMPGAVLGAYLADMKWLKPRQILGGFFVAQGILGFIMAACYKQLAEPKNTGAFVVVYGIFLAFGEAGPGDNIGLFASKTSATAIRGKYYGIAAAVGKVGAYVGSYCLKPIQDSAGPDTDAFKIVRGQRPFWVASTIAVFAGLVALFFLPDINQDSIEQEDVKFREFLHSHGYDTSQMGVHGSSTEDFVDSGEIRERAL